MDLKNCKKCGRMFPAPVGESFCSKCRTDDTDEFKRVREYLYDNPGVDIHTVSKETNVDERKILKFLKQERLEILEEGNNILKCDRCGKSIKTGRYCDKCKGNLMNELNGAASNIKTDIQSAQKDNPIYHTSKIQK